MNRLEDMTEPELQRLMTAIAKSIEATAEALNCEKPLFALVVFNDPKIAQYICNCERSTMIMAMRETAERLEKRQDIQRSPPKRRRR